MQSCWHGGYCSSFCAPAYTLCMVMIMRYSIEGFHNAMPTYTHTILSHCLVSFCMPRNREKQQQNAGTSNDDLKFPPSVCANILVTLYNLVLWYELIKATGQFVTFPLPFRSKRKPTWRSQLSMMTCKIGLIWRHMKILYKGFARRETHLYEHDFTPLLGFLLYGEV